MTEIQVLDRRESEFTLVLTECKMSISVAQVVYYNTDATHTEQFIFPLIPEEYFYYYS